MRIVLSAIRSYAVCLGLCVASLLWGGCARQRKTDAWTPPPMVTWQDVTSTAARPPANGYARVGEVATTGRFPASLAVSRVAIAQDEGAGGTRHAYLPPRPKNEFLQWNSAFDDQMAISEVFPIAPRDLGGGAAVPEQVVAACRALNARLGLIYATNYLSPTETEMIGALYETETATPIAVIHAKAASIVPPEEEQKRPVNLWKYDSRALVRFKFERLVYSCVRELILSDEPETVDVPEGWIPPAPPVPVQWPPRNF